MMEASSVTAVLFAKDHLRVAAFYAGALGMRCVAQDEHHSRLDCRGFELIVHRIPRPTADGIALEQPPRRRTSAAIRLDYAVESLAASRRAARSLGGGIDDAPPEWAARDANFFFGYDPEGNQFGVREQPA